MAREYKSKHLGDVKDETPDMKTTSTSLEKPKTRADYEEDYKRGHTDLLAELLRDSAGM